MRCAQFLAKRIATLVPIFIDAEIDSQRNDGKLIAPSNAKIFVDLFALLIADYHDPIGGQLSKQSFDCEKKSSLVPAVITVKDVTVIGVHKAATPWLAD